MKNECDACNLIELSKIPVKKGDEKYCWMCGSRTTVEWTRTSLQRDRDWQCSNMICPHHHDVYSRSRDTSNGRWGPWRRITPITMPKITPVNLVHEHFNEREGSCRGCMHRHHCSAGSEGLSYGGTCDLHEHDVTTVLKKVAPEEEFIE